MAVKSVNDLLMDELQDIYHAEKQLVKALPKMAKKAKSDQLRQAVEHHLEQTKGHVQRLEQVFAKLDAPPRAKKCEAMEGLIEEAEELMGEIATPEVLDAAMIGAAQKVEHYEIASYGTLSTLAQELGHTDAARLLEQTLDEEKAADQKLNQIALSGVNKRALQVGCLTKACGPMQGPAAAVAGPFSWRPGPETRASCRRRGLDKRLALPCMAPPSPDVGQAKEARSVG